MKFIEKTTRYFFEFAILFISVTSAFYVENYRQSLEDEENKQKYLRGILDDLQTDSIAFSNSSSRISLFIVQIDSFQVLLKKEGSSTYDKIRLLAQFGMMNFDIGNENSSNYKSIINSGQIKLVESEEYRKNLNNYYRTGDIRLKRYEDEFLIFRTYEFFPYLNTNLNFGDFFWDGNFHMVEKEKLKTNPAIFQDQRLVNYVIRTRQFFHDFRNDIDEMRSANKRLLAETREQLNK